MPPTEPAAAHDGSHEPASSASRLPGQPVDPPPDAGHSDEAGQSAQWRRLHRVTPLLNAWKVGAAVFLIAMFNAQEFLADLRAAFPAMAILGLIVALIVVAFVVGLIISVLAWRRTTYGVSEESLFLHKGILFRQQRHVRLDRVQAIEVTQPLLARIFGFASLKVESAGGAGSNLQLAFLTEPDAQGLRRELLTRVAGIKAGGSEPDAAGAGPEAGHTPAAVVPERQIAALSPGRLIGSLALSFSVVAIALVLVGFITVAILTRTPGIVVGSIAPLLGAAFYLWSRFAGEFAFRAAISADGIRLRQGLLETKARTVPPGRVQAVGISQPLLWRFKDWWRIQVNIAGYAETETTGSVLYPAATRQEVAYMLSLVLPDLGDPRPLPVLHTAMDGIGPEEGFTTSPRRARWVDPLTWRRTAFRITDTAILLRTGRWWRHLNVVPHERIQSLGSTQGPIERRMRLATFVVHSTPGPVTPQVRHLDVAVAQQLLVDQAERARLARREAGSQRWLTGTGSADRGDVAPQEQRRRYAGVLPARPESPRATPPASAREEPGLPPAAPPEGPSGGASGGPPASLWEGPAEGPSR